PPGPITIRLTGVATGVRKAAAEAIVTLISTGRAETPISAEAATAIGMMINAVAVLLMSWPRIAVNRNSPPRSARGPASPTRRTRPSAISCAAPLVDIAVESGIDRADQDHRRPVDRAIGLVDGDHAEQHHRAGGDEAGDHRRHHA